MILKCLFIIRKSDAHCSPPPELLVAWDEFTIEENPEGFERAWKRELQACQPDVESFRLVDVEVSADKIRELLLAPPTIAGEINGY